MNSEPTTNHPQEIVLKTENVNVYYGDFLAVKGIYIERKGFCFYKST